MKKILSVILCVLMLVPCFVFSAFADGTEEEPTNLALDASIKVSSTWNQSTPAQATVNGRIESDFDGGHENYWSPNGTGRDPTVDVNNTFIQYSFKGANNGYKLIQQVDVYVAHVCRNNITYTLYALLNGVWVEIGSLRDREVDGYAYVKDGKEISSAESNYVKLSYVMPETIEVDGAETPVNTKSLKIVMSTYGNATGGCGEYWCVPKIYETVITGTTGFIPEIDLHDGALLSNNAVLGGTLSASSSASNKYPALAADDNTTTHWTSKLKTNGEWIMSEFDKEYSISALSFNLGAVKLSTSDTDTHSYGVDVELRIDGVWQSVYAGTVTTSTSVADSIQIPVSSTYEKVDAMKITFTEMNGAAAALTEMNASIANNGKCEFLADFMTIERKQSVAIGNVAIYGTAYASTVFDYLGISDVNYINDGGVSDESYSWYSATLAKDQYCGVTLPNAVKVTGVTLYFNDCILCESYNIYNPLDSSGWEDTVAGNYVLGYEVQAKIDGEYKTIAKGTSYDPTKGESDDYKISFEITEDVTTDDIRVFFTETDAGFAYLKEIEIYSDFKYDAYSTYLTSRTKVPTTKTFAEHDIIKRASFHQEFYPIHYFASINDLRASLWM